MDTTYYVKRLLSPEALVALLGVYFVQAVAVKLYCLFIYPYYVSPLRHLPGPKDHHFLIGQALNQFRSGNPNEPFVSWMRKWPTAPLIRYFNIGNSDAVLVTSLAAHKEILHDKCYSFAKPAFFTRLISDIVGYGIVFSEGEEHKRQRKVLGGLFTTSNLTKCVPMFQRKASHLSSLLERIIETEDGIVELVSVYSKIMLDIMGVFALGVELDNLGLGSDSITSFHECYHEVFEPDSVGQLLVAINAFIPIRWLPLESNRRFAHATKVVRGQLVAIIRDRIRSVNARKKAGMGGMGGNVNEFEDLLTFMVTEKYNTSSEPWTEDDILNQILTFLAAGHETTASALVWGTHLLTKHPEASRRLQAEVSSLLRRSPTPSYREMESLSYLNNFSRELLRVQCPAIHAPREAVEDVVIQGVRLPKGTTVLMYPAVVQHNPTIWGPDCDEFDPDRWDRLEGEATNPQAFAAFMQGPRVCIGKAMTMMELKVILIELVSKFRFEAIGQVETQDIELVSPSALLRPKGGIKVKVGRMGG